MTAVTGPASGANSFAERERPVPITAPELLGPWRAREQLASNNGPVLPNKCPKPKDPGSDGHRKRWS